MNKLLIVLILLISAGSMPLNAQTFDKQNKKFLLGMGIDIEIIDNGTNPVRPPTNLVFNFDLLNRIRIETGLGIVSRELELTDNVDILQNGRASLNRQCYNFGGYYLSKAGQLSPYFGFNYDFISNSYESYVQYIFTEESSESRISSVVGFEFKFADKFSFSGEFLIMRSKKESSYEANDDIRLNTGDGWGTGSKIKFRFYF